MSAHRCENGLAGIMILVTYKKHVGGMAECQGSYHLILMTVLCSWHHYPHLTDKETEAQEN